MEISTTSSSTLRSMLADEAMAVALVPWACPCDFGPGGRYRLEELIGIGRRSFVYRARDSRLSSAGFDAHVAIKITPTSSSAPTPTPAPISGSSGPASSTLLKSDVGVVGVAGQRAMNRSWDAATDGDALAARRVTHPNVLQILDRGVDETGAHYLVAEYVDGGTLEDTQAPRLPEDAAKFVATLARAVQAAHMAGVVHCDLKPSNILLTREGVPKLADFDLSFSPANTDDTHRGNLAFMSPEQFDQEDNALTPSADVYGLGGILYWLLSGKMPHGDSVDEVVAFHRAKRPVPLPPVEPDLAAICAKALARERPARYESALSLADDLDRWLAHLPLPWTRPSIARKARLLARRSPMLVALGALALLATIPSAYIGYDKTIGERRREVEAQKAINEKTQQELEKVRAQLKLVIRSAAAATDYGGRGGVERILPSLYWLEWFRGQIVTNTRGEVEFPRQRIESLAQIIEEAEANGTAGHTDILVARFALAGYLVDDNNGAAALKHVEWLENHWAPKLDTNDVVVLSLSALRACAEAELAMLTPSSSRSFDEKIETQLTRLRAVRDQLQTDGRPTVMLRIVERAIARMSPQAAKPDAR